MASENPEPGKRAASSLEQVSMAMELPIVMVVWVIAGGGAGFFLDRWLHTSPFLMLLGGALGFGGGMRDLVKRLSRGRKQGSGHGGR
jgi:F0F1-type ATP synthase assembly protein I